mmetsp:Transcript_66540/g.185500  ORF Transcript_66540/g.185500 Transcript_66540/m.185500 type:complete len:361 (+) Transcript_66540:1188-2270(+)
MTTMALRGTFSLNSCTASALPLTSTRMLPSRSLTFSPVMAASERPQARNCPKSSRLNALRSVVWKSSVSNRSVRGVCRTNSGGFFSSASLGASDCKSRDAAEGLRVRVPGVCGGAGRGGLDAVGSTGALCLSSSSSLGMTVGLNSGVGSPGTPVLGMGVTSPKPSTLSAPGMGAGGEGVMPPRTAPGCGDGAGVMPPSAKGVMAPEATLTGGDGVIVPAGVPQTASWAARCSTATCACTLPPAMAFSSCCLSCWKPPETPSPCLKGSGGGGAAWVGKATCAVAGAGGGACAGACAGATPGGYMRTTCIDACADLLRESIHCFTVARNSSGRLTPVRTAAPSADATEEMSPFCMPWTISDM